MKNIAKLLDDAQSGVERLDTSLNSLNKNISIQMLETVGREYDNTLYMPTEQAINTFASILNALGQVDLLNEHQKELVYQTVCEFLNGRGGLMQSRDQKVVAHERYTDEKGWIAVNAVDIEHYKSKGQPIRDLIVKE